MSLFTRKEKFTVYSEFQKDEFIEKLEKAHVDYQLREDRSSVFNDKTMYIFSVRAGELKNVI
ncbi:MAG: hypothetical protein K6E68_04495 [Lachnospiraceae bacterium]|nr:hypothetical protein [Lachnospiraceae bacterium]